MTGKKIITINNYTVNKSEQLGEGGNANVYSAIDKNNNTVAIKILKVKTENFTKKLKRFKIEVKKVSNIQCENSGVLPIIDYSLNKAPYYYTMPIAVTLKNHFKDNNNIEDKVKAIIKIAECLKQLHTKDITHRDIKPSNMYYYKDSFVLADFGLVSYPNKEKLSSTGERIGNRETIAPEMDESANVADSKKSDIYSLAKSLWMLLTDAKKGFEGIYNVESNKMGLSFNTKYTKEHLVELEELLVSSTQDVPALRPNISEFISKLNEYLRIRKNHDSICQSQWKFIYSSLFKHTTPSRAFFYNINDIIKALNLISRLPNMNHTFLPDGGGLDFVNVEKATENGCIRLYFEPASYMIIKPKFLIIEHFGNDYIFNYFRLESCELKSLFSDKTNDFNCEWMIEDYPGHYVQSMYEDYGYYNDGETKLPKGFKFVRRYSTSSFVIFAKSSIYNDISSTYDARHNQIDHEKFRNYIDALRLAFYLGSKTQNFTLFNTLAKISFKKEENKTSEFIPVKQNLDDFISKNYSNWNFLDICSEYSENKSSFTKFSIEFSSSGMNLTARLKNKYYLAEDFTLHKKTKHIGLEEDRFFFISSRVEIVEIAKKIEDKIKKIINDNGKTWSDSSYHIEKRLIKIKNPTHLFTKKEVYDVIKNGDDFKNNVLAMDERGYVHLIDADEKKFLYPVIFETFCAGKNYVGKFTDEIYADTMYLSLLQGLLDYLESGTNQYVDDIESTSEEDLLKEIEKYFE